MRRMKSRFEGQNVTIMADGFDYPIEGCLEGIKREAWDDETDSLFYQVNCGEDVYFIEVDSVSWISTKPMQQPKPKLKVIQIDKR